MYLWLADHGCRVTPNDLRVDFDAPQLGQGEGLCTRRCHRDLQLRRRLPVRHDHGRGASRQCGQYPHNRVLCCRAATTASVRARLWLPCRRPGSSRRAVAHGPRPAHLSTTGRLRGVQGRGRCDLAGPRRPTGSRVVDRQPVQRHRSQRQRRVGSATRPRGQREGALARYPCRSAGKRPAHSSPWFRSTTWHAS